MFCLTKTRFFRTIYLDLKTLHSNDEKLIIFNKKKIQVIKGFFIHNQNKLSTLIHKIFVTTCLLDTYLIFLTIVQCGQSPESQPLSFNPNTKQLLK